MIKSSNLAGQDTVNEVLAYQIISNSRMFVQVKRANTQIPRSASYKVEDKSRSISHLQYLLESGACYTYYKHIEKGDDKGYPNWELQLT